MILGVRQCGKTYIINEFCENEFKNYYKLNLLQRSDIVNLYKSNMNSLEKYKQLKSMINFDMDKYDTILFIDEIQESEELISELKYFCEEHNNVRIICAGSLLGVKLKRFSKSFLVGKINMINMYPMDFEEFLIAFNEEMLLNYIKECFTKNKAMNALHDKAMQYYKKYLITGGMPESIMNMIEIESDYVKYNKNILNNIIESYFDDMKKYIETPTETLKIRRLYYSLPNQLISNDIKLSYWKSKEEAEVDFLIETDNDGIIPIEVKSSFNTQSKSLKIYQDLYKPKYMIRISSKDFGYNTKTKIKSIPLYEAFLIKELTK